MVKVYESLMEKALNKTKSETLYFGGILLLVLVMFVVVILNTFVFFNVLVKGPSMQPTMYTDDVLVANRLKTPTYGSIIIISGEKNNGDWLIKRVIAMEGDTVDIRSDGYVYVKYKNADDFIRLNESYIKEPGKTDMYDWTIKTIGQGEIFYLGDNRGNSNDSRNLDFSTCNTSQVVGVVEDWSFAFKGFNKKLKNLFDRR